MSVRLVTKNLMMILLQSEAIKYFKRSGLLLCNCCSPKDEYFGEATLFDKSTIKEINDVKRKHENFEDELRNSVNTRSCEESESEFELSNGLDSFNEESQQSAFIWENNHIWPKSVFKFPPRSKRGDGDRRPTI